ncbi:hypothetical protein BC829DRAFT_490199 [Chytridium lagenaria]|nr:hypothetical protein BC829DRAFT_490199 [Chytridium lagenaria]
MASTSASVATAVPPSSLMLACCGRFLNHVSLINNVYPSEPGEVGPRSSALSLLVFYASSKPQKLEKVGAYLEVKLKSDARKNRNGYLTVTLDILNSLMDNCATHINLISKSILRIILEVLGNPDPELFLQATTTFVKFCSVHNHDSTLDKEFTELFSTLVDKFCNFATYETNDQILSKTLKAVVSSESFQLVPQLDVYVSKIVPAILTNIKNKKKKALQAAAAAARKRTSVDDPLPPLPPNATVSNPHQHDSASLNPSSSSTAGNAATAQPTSDSDAPASSIPLYHPRRHHSPSKRASITDELFTDSEVEHSAEASLRDLVSRCTSATTLRTILDHIFRYLDDHGEWASAPYVVHVVRCVSGAAQPQHRYVLLSRVLELLDEERFTQTQGVSVKITLVRSLGMVVASAGGTVGLAVMELVDALIRQLVASVSAAQAFLPAREEGVKPGLWVALVKAVSGLSVNIEYPDQMNDILSFVVLVGVILARYDAVVGTSLDQAENAGNGLGPGGNTGSIGRATDAISLSLLLPILDLLDDVDPDIRVTACGPYLGFMGALPTASGAVSVRSINSGVASIGMEFVRGVHGKVFGRLGAWGVEGVREPVPAEYLVLGNLVAVMQRRFFAEAVVVAIPMVFKLQALALDAVDASPSHRRATSNLVLEHLLSVSRSHSLTTLIDTLVRLRDQRIEAGEWYLPASTSAISSPSLHHHTGVATSPVVASHPHALDHAIETRCPVRSGCTLEKLEQMDGNKGVLSPPSKRLAVDREGVLEAVLGDPAVARVERARERIGEEFVVVKVDVANVVGERTKAQSLGVPTERRGAVSVRTASIKRSDAAAAAPVKVDDLKDVLAGSPALASGRPQSTDPGAVAYDGDASVGVVSVVSAEKSRSNVKVLLKNISVNLGLDVLLARRCNLLPLNLSAFPLTPLAPPVQKPPPLPNPLLRRRSYLSTKPGPTSKPTTASAMASTSSSSGNIVTMPPQGMSPMITPSTSVGAIPIQGGAGAGNALGVAASPTKGGFRNAGVEVFEERSVEFVVDEFKAC